MIETQPTSMDDHITGEDLETLTLEELEKLFLTIYAALEKIFHTVSSSAQGGTQIEAQRLAMLGLENQFKEGWQVLKATIEAILYHAIFPKDILYIRNFGERSLLELSERLQVKGFLPQDEQR